MKIISYMTRAVPALAVGIGALGVANAVTLKSLKDSQLTDLYGIYAPGGDCKREPRIKVDDSGLAYEYAGHSTHSTSIEYALTYGGPNYAGISRWIFPFPVNDNDVGRVLMVFNPEEKPGTLTAEPNLGLGEHMSEFQAALVKASPYAKCAKTP